MSYDGGKGNVFQIIINQFPPHDLYVDAFLGNSAVLRQKRPAARNIGCELDPKALALWRGDEVPGLELVQMCGISFLRALRSSYPFTGRELVYLDPPYMFEARESKDARYAFEFTDDQHAELLKVVADYPCMVAISGYHTARYADALRTWRSITFQSVKRNGKMGTEWLWMNYPEPMELHDYRFLGQGFRQRERMKRKRTRWLARLQQMDLLERHMLMSAIEDFRAGL